MQEPSHLITPDVIGRFWKYVEKRSPEDCWMWKGGDRNYSGRGRLKVRRKKVSATRICWFIHTGAWPPQDKVVAHECDVPGCVNPAHLKCISQSENIQEAFDKGRKIPPSLLKTHCPHGHEYTPENTYFSKPHGARRCRICLRTQLALRKQRSGGVQ